MKLYFNELAPWERLDEYRDGKEIKRQLTNQTEIAKQQLAVLSRDYPLAVADQYSYSSYLDANRYGVSDDAIYAVKDAIGSMQGEISDAVNRNSEIMGAGFDKVSGEINKQTSAMKKGMVGMALTQVASTALIMKTLNKNVSFLTETISGGFDLMHGNMRDIVSGIGNLSCEIGEFRGDFNIAMGNVMAQIELSRNEMQNGLKHISSILENRRKTDAQEHFEDALGFYKDGNRFSSEPQWFRDAKEHFLASIELYSRNPLAHLYLAHIYHYQKEHRDFKKAFEHYRLSAIYGMSDKDTHCISAKGYFFAAWLQASVFGDIKEAIDYSKKAIQLDPEFLRVYYYLAKYYVKVRNTREAISVLGILFTKHDRKYAIKVLLDPDFEPVIESVKQLLGRLKEGAISQFEKIVEEIRTLLYGQKDERYSQQSNELEEVVKVARKRNTYYDYLDATVFLNQKKSLIQEEISADIGKRFKDEQLLQEKEKADKKKEFIAQALSNLIGGQVVDLKKYLRMISSAHNGEKDEKLIFMPHLAVDGNGVFTAPKVEYDKKFFVIARTEISDETLELEIIVKALKLTWNSFRSIHAGEDKIDLGIRLENDPDGEELNFSCEFVSSPLGKLLPKGKYLPPVFIPRTATVKIKAKAGEKELEIEFDLNPPLCPICKVEELDADGRCPSCGDTKYTVKGAAKCPRCLREKGWTGSRCTLCNYPGTERKPV